MRLDELCMGSVPKPAVSQAAAERVRRAAAAVTALGCLLLGVFIAAHHPITPSVVLALFLVWTAACLFWPALWLLIVPAAISVIGFAPWTGWLMLEEWDLLALGAAAAGYASIALRREFCWPTPIHAQTPCHGTVWCSGK